MLAKAFNGPYKPSAAWAVPRMRTARSGEVNSHINVPPQQVWDALADVERMGQWSPECHQVRWLGDARSPAKVGARFAGSNKYDWLRWSIKCEVKIADPPRELAWSTLRGTREMVRWRFLLEPVDDGTDLTESFECPWLPLDARFAEDFLTASVSVTRERALGWTHTPNKLRSQLRTSIRCQPVRTGPSRRSCAAEVSGFR